MNKILFVWLLLLPFWGMSQNFILQDSIHIDIPDSYTFSQADIFNSFYFISKEKNLLLKYNSKTQQTYILDNFTPSKKLFIVTPLFLVVLNKTNKTLEFYDDKLISTQDKNYILSDQIINPDLIYIQDNKQLTYFDEFTTGSFIQYDYRNHKNLFFSNSISKNISSDFSLKEIYISSKSKSLLLQKTNTQDSLTEYKIINQKNNGAITSYIIPSLKEYFWNEQNFLWIDKNHFYFYDFDNDPERIELPEKDGDFYILNRQLFLWKSKVMYIYRLESEK